MDKLLGTGSDSSKNALVQFKNKESEEKYAMDVDAYPYEMKELEKDNNQDQASGEIKRKDLLQRSQSLKPSRKTVGVHNYDENLQETSYNNKSKLKELQRLNKTENRSQKLTLSFDGMFSGPNQFQEEIEKPNSQPTCSENDVFEGSFHFQDAQEPQDLNQMSETCQESDCSMIENFDALDQSSWKAQELTSHELDFKSCNQELSCIKINSQDIDGSFIVSFDPKAIHLELPSSENSLASISVLLSESDVEQVHVSYTLPVTFICITLTLKMQGELTAFLRTYYQNIESIVIRKEISAAEKLKLSFELNVTDSFDSFITFLHDIYGEKKISVASTASNPSKEIHGNSHSSIFKCPPEGYIQLCEKDIVCLKEKEWLNDSIIEFYSQFIYYEKIPSEKRAETLICSPLFYADVLKYVKETKQGWEPDIKRMKITASDSLSTTCGTSPDSMDIFSKNFIFIPVNVRTSHWFLAVLCHLPELLKESDSSRATDGDESAVKKCPCIYFFDSMDKNTDVGEEKKEVAKNLKRYFGKIHPSATGIEKNWDQMLLSKPCCPQQQNIYDCGIYLLQFIESFFEKPISYFRFSSYLMDWFTEDRIQQKRSEIKKLLSGLIETHAYKIVSCHD